MRVKITDRARELYKEVCPVSYRKCLTQDDVDYKIQRCVDLGRWNTLDQDLSYITVTYYKNKLVVLNGEIIDMFKTEDEYFEVDEDLKYKHWAKHYDLITYE